MQHPFEFIHDDQTLLQCGEWVIAALEYLQ